MKTATRSRAGPARWLALLATALLFMGTIATPALGEAEDFGEAEILSSPDNTCDKAFPDLDKIDQESGTFTTEEGVVLEWGGYGASAKNAVHYTVPEGYTLDLCIKGGEGAETPAYHEGLTGTGSVTTLYERDVSHISYRVNVLPPTGSATVLKAWDGDLFDDADIEVTFTGHIDGGDPLTLVPNQVTDLDIGQTLTITDEAVTGMPDGCIYGSDLGDGASFTATEEQLHGTITITNTVACEEEPSAGSVTIVKEWTGDEFDDSELEVGFWADLDDERMIVHEETLPLEIGQTLTLLDEQVDGLPEGCDYTSDLESIDASFTATEEQPHGTITVTNEATCEDEEPELIPVGLYKMWLDADGEVILEDTPDADFTLTLSVGDDILATLDQDVDPPWAWADLEPGSTYTVAETNLADGWETVDCPELDPELTGAGEHSGVGTFDLTDGGRHFVCNQEMAELPPAVFTLALQKVWLDADGDELDVAPDEEFEVVMFIDDEEALVVDETTEGHRDVIEMEYGTPYEVDEPTLPEGWELVTCPAQLLETDELAVAHGVGDDFVADEAGVHYVCNQEIPDEVLPVVIPPEEEKEEEPKVEPKVEEKKVDEEPEVEVLAEVKQRTLPRTGADAGALALLAAGMLMIGAATLASTKPAPARRRRQ
jgi:hypothetical protein